MTLSSTLPAASIKLSFHKATDGFNRWDMGIQAGGGYVFHLKKTNLALDLRYSYGLSSIAQDTERYNRALNLSVLIFKPWKKNPFAKHQ